MSIHNKKSSIELPFTQLWYNFSKQCEKENRAIAKAHKQSKIRNGEHLPSKSMYDQSTLQQKRQSLNINNKKLSELDEHNIAITHLIKNKQKQNFISNDVKVQDNSNNQNSVCEQRSVIVEGSCGESAACNNSIISGKSKVKVSDKILQVIQSNVIPFLVDKFIQVEERVTNRIKKLQSVITKQKSEIQTLKQNQKHLQQSVQLLKSEIEKLGIQGKQICRQKNCQCKTLVEVGNSPVGFHEDVAYQKQTNLPEFSNRRITIQQHELNLRQISHLLQQLTTTIQQSGIRSEQKMNQFQKQIKKLTQRQKVGEEKLEKQFAEKILELISTYNDNFVDLDKRITKVEDIVEPSVQSQKMPFMPVNFLAELQKIKPKQNKTNK